MQSSYYFRAPVLGSFYMEIVCDATQYFSPVEMPFKISLKNTMYKEIAWQKHEGLSSKSWFFFLQNYTNTIQYFAPFL